MKTPGTYSVASYGEQIKYKLRVKAYADALKRVVTPDTVVLDIGTGTGILALLACQYGARQVYAIDPAKAIHVARDIAISNGFGERIDFIQDISTRVTLPKRADVIVSDIHGLLPMHEHYIATIVDARNRLLAPGGVLIPFRESVKGALIEDPDLYASIVSPWEDTYESLDMEAARRMVVNRFQTPFLTAEYLLSEPQELISWNNATVVNPDVHGVLNWFVNRAGTLHGIDMWYDTSLVEGIEYSTGPFDPEKALSDVFFPLERPVSLSPGDKVSFTFSANLVVDSYIYNWETRIWDESNSPQIKAHFKQSTFFSQSISMQTMMKRHASYTPKVNMDGAIEHFALAQMDGHTTIDEISRRLVDHFPERMPTPQTALEWVAELSQSLSV